MKRLPLLTLFLLLPIASAIGSTGIKRVLNPSGVRQPRGAHLPKLYDGQADEVLEVGKGPLLPQRVYAVFDDPHRQWYLALTNPQGKFPAPMEYLSFGSILLGANLGRHDGTVHYRFDRSWKWVSTDRAERRFFWVQSDPPVLRKEYYLKFIPSTSSHHQVSLGKPRKSPR